MSAKIKKLNNTSKEIYNEKDKIKELERCITDLQKLKIEITKLEKLRLDTSTLIKKEIKEADDKQNEITFENVNNIFSYVISINDVIQKLYNDFIVKYNNNEIIKNAQLQISEKENKFYSRENEIYEKREQRKQNILEEIKKLRKPITIIFILIQILLLVILVPISVYLFGGKKLDLVFFCLNAIGFIGYIILVCRQFNQYNQVIERINESFNKNEKYFSTGKLIRNIIFACFFFVLAQLCFLVMKYPDIIIKIFLYSLLILFVLLILFSVTIFFIGKSIKNKS